MSNSNTILQQHNNSILEQENTLAPSAKLKNRIHDLKLKRSNKQQDNNSSPSTQNMSNQQTRKSKKHPQYKLTRNDINALLSKIGINNTGIVDEVMHELSIGRIRTPQDVAAFLVQRLSTLFPQNNIQTNPQPIFNSEIPETQKTSSVLNAQSQDKSSSSPALPPQDQSSSSTALPPQDQSSSSSSSIHKVRPPLRHPKTMRKQLRHPSGQIQSK